MLSLSSRFPPTLSVRDACRVHKVSSFVEDQAFVFRGMMCSNVLLVTLFRANSPSVSAYAGDRGKLALNSEFFLVRSCARVPAKDFQKSIQTVFGKHLKSNVCTRNYVFFPPMILFQPLEIQIGLRVSCMAQTAAMWGNLNELFESSMMLGGWDGGLGVRNQLQ